MSALRGRTDLTRGISAHDPKQTLAVGKPDTVRLSDFLRPTPHMVSVNFFEKRILRLDHVAFASKLSSQGDQGGFLHE
jgi:hypothetical protein